MIVSEGIELSREAIECANVNIAKNGIKGSTFSAGNIHQLQKKLSEIRPESLVLIVRQERDLKNSSFTSSHKNQNLFMLAATEYLARDLVHFIKEGLKSIRFTASTFQA